MESEHLKKIMGNQERTANLQVVFIDIEKYSKRRTSTQISVIDAFTKLLTRAMKTVAQQYIEYSQKNSINFQNDIITLPTGDGALLIFSFNGLIDIHLTFVKNLLHFVHELNQKNNCEKFKQNAWCNCHNSMNLRFGVSEGKAIIYVDINGKYNAAGSVVNMASRVMNKVDGNQVAFTEEAYKQIVDLTEDPNFSDQFKEYKNITIKHGVTVNIYLYIGKTEDSYINSNPPKFLDAETKTRLIMGKMRDVGIPIPNDRSLFEDNPSAFVDLLDGMSKSFAKFKELSDKTPKE